MTLGVVLGASIAVGVVLVLTPNLIGLPSLAKPVEFENTPSDLDVVQDGFDTWEAGGFNGGQAEENLARIWSHDAVFDFTANINEPLYTVYHGHAELKILFQNLPALKFEHFKPIVFKGPSGTVLAKTMYTNVLVSTGAKAPFPQGDFLEFRVGNGKITHAKIFYGNQKQTNELWATETIGTVKNAENAWASGKMVDAESLQPFFTADIMLDATANVPATDKYKVYLGIDGVLAFTQFLTSFQFPDMAMTYFPGPQADIVMAKMSSSQLYMPTGKSSPMTSDIVLYKIVDQKIAYMKFFWSDPASIGRIMS